MFNFLNHGKIYFILFLKIRKYIFNIIFKTEKYSIMWPPSRNIPRPSSPKANAGFYTQKKISISTFSQKL